MFAEQTKLDVRDPPVSQNHLRGSGELVLISFSIGWVTATVTTVRGSYDRMREQERAKLQAKKKFSTLHASPESWALSVWRTVLAMGMEGIMCTGIGRWTSSIHRQTCLDQVWKSIHIFTLHYHCCYLCAAVRFIFVLNAEWGIFISQIHYIKSSVCSIEQKSQRTRLLRFVFFSWSGGPAGGDGGGAPPMSFACGS